MVPLYLAAAAVSWVLTGDFGARNVFERQAGLADGGYTDQPLRPVFRRVSLSGRGGSVAQARQQARRCGSIPGRLAAARDRSTASPSR